MNKLEVLRGNQPLHKIKRVDKYKFVGSWVEGNCLKTNQIYSIFFIVDEEGCEYEYILTDEKFENRIYVVANSVDFVYLQPDHDFMDAWRKEIFGDSDE